MAATEQSRIQVAAMDVDADESLVSRRSKRSTAGNRMEAALAELALEDLTKEAEDDKDFFVEKDEEDIFGSDFESTDEETAQAEVETGDKAVDEEERRTRKAVRTRLERQTAAAHARNKVTFDPQARAQASTSSSKSKPSSKSKGKKKGRRVSFVDGGKIVDDAEDEDEGKGKGKRQSRRSHTVLNTSATVSRMKNAEERRASFPKKVPIQQKFYTQDELLSRALDTEEGNIIEHRDYLKMEEEKRKRAKVVRAQVEGPLVRWVSKVEEVKVDVIPAPLGYRYGYPSGYYPYTGTQHYPNVNGQPSASGSTSTNPHYPNVIPSQSSATSTLTPYASQSASTSQPQSQPQTSYYHPPNPGNAAPQHSQPLPILQPIQRLEKVCKNYVIHEASQTLPAQKPPWQETMGALFGDDVNWEEMKVWAGKGRPLSRPKQTCPLTGVQAKYLDPRTNVPFANVRAYQTLTKILKHDYIWSSSLKCYVGAEGENRAMGIEGKTREKSDGKGKKARDDDAMDIS